MSVHGLTSVSSPTHSAPPCAGAGFVHVRVLVAVPVPHVTEHLLTSDHSLQAPSTGSDISDEPDETYEGNRA